jgi:dienelactone hydrolase
MIWPGWLDFCASGNWSPMRWLKQKIDRWAISAAAKSLPRVPPDPGQRRQVELALAREDLFIPPERIPEVRVASDFSWQFDSSVKTPFHRNNTVYGKLFPALPDWSEKPGVVLVHGWNAEAHYTKVVPRIGKALARAGINGIAIELPYHLHRRPAREERITDFISENIPRMLEATTQAIADLNAILLWLKTRGSPQTALWGFSLGGWLAGLHLCASGAQDAAVLTTPVSNLEQAVRELEFCHPIRSALEVCPVELRPLNLSSRRPKIAPERVLLVEGRYDQFVPHSSYTELAEAWGIENWNVVPQSHLSILVSRRATRTCIAWLTAQLRSTR